MVDKNGVLIRKGDILLHNTTGYLCTVVRAGKTSMAYRLYGVAHSHIYTTSRRYRCEYEHLPEEGARTDAT